ncbi:tetratricopeptide repeat protein [Qipengyuania sediminis]|uniref:tetratricopeptide repeat protein n=1 Tax=Qipengyuania sediminis TaxID=1532023 RepID=UPI001404BEB2|nr:tetratricopeptide repeat protein [Qipengyuania sediminis]
MALPDDPAAREQALARRRAAEEETLLREVDDAVRQDDLASFASRYGRQIAIGAGVLVLGFGGWLFWDNRQEAARQAESEAIIAALDRTQAANWADAAAAAAPLISESAEGPKASARLIAAGAAAEQNNVSEAEKQLSDLTADASAPQAMRDLARLRLAALRFDRSDKAQLIRELGPLARPGNPWFGSAGELVAMAHLEQGRPAEAGRLFATIARDEDVPDSIRSRARQMAGVLGIDAIPDVRRFLQQQERQQREQAAGGGAAAASPAG